MATAGQLRELRRKYHLGEFRRDASPTKTRKQSSAGPSRRIMRRRIKIGGFMARRGRKRGGGFGKKLLPIGGMLGAAILGVGAAALAKRFIGAPLGAFTGAALGFAVGGIGGAAGGYLHDNIGNVGGVGSSGGQTIY